MVCFAHQDAYGIPPVYDLRADHPGRTRHPRSMTRFIAVDSWCHEMTRLRICIVLLMYGATTGVLAAEADSAIALMEDLLWSKSSQGRYEMVIETPYWRRTLELDVKMQRPDRSFVRVLSPVKERGIGSLRLGSEMWNYIPKIDRVVKIPPSMMLQPWMGSDFSNDDLVKQTSLRDDYSHRIGAETRDELMHIVSTPKPGAAVVWGRVESWIEPDTGIPHRQTYFDEAGAAVRELSFSDVRTMDGHTLPTRWEMRPLNGENKRTQVLIQRIEFDLELDPAWFTQRQLRAQDY